MKYTKLKKELKDSQDLYNDCLKKLVFEKLQNDFTLGVLNEIEVLADRNVSPGLIAKVIKNAKERHYLDKLIHADLLK